MIYPFQIKEEIQGIGKGRSLWEIRIIDCHRDIALPIKETRNSQAHLQQESRKRPNLKGIYFTVEENGDVSIKYKKSLFTGHGTTKRTKGTGNQI